jgi:hypothetical protein
MLPRKKNKKYIEMHPRQKKKKIEMLERRSFARFVQQ